MNTNAVMNAIAELDLEPVKTKLMHAASGEGWSRAKAEALDLEYRRFLYLMHAFPNEETAPTVDVDTFWHYHILDTMKYARDCEAVFGYFLHHYPHLGMEGAHDAGAELRGAERMRQLYEQTFGQDYIRAEVYGTDGAQAAFCMRMPSQPAAQGNDAAFCMRHAALKGMGAAFCMRHAGQPGAAGNQAAFCMREPVRPVTGTQAAFCMREPVRPATGTQAAFCMRHSGQPKAAGNDAAFCMRHADGKAAGSAAAFCMRQSAPVRPAQPGARAAFCMRQQGPQQAAANDAGFGDSAAAAQAA